ncbi:MAG: hypothetical protein ACI9AR_000204 [Flavobacteriaceae bacterium]|jgi:hypothetical protein
MNNIAHKRNIFKLTLLALCIAFVVFTLSLWIPNIQLVWELFTNGSLPLGIRMSILLSLYGSIGTNFNVLSATYTILISLLVGVNISAFVYYVRSRRDDSSVKKTTAVGVGGLISGVFGIGCAACGTFILTSLLSVVGVAGVLAFLPLRGEEFGILAVLLLAYSLYSLRKKIKEPLVCEV